MYPVTPARIFGRLGHISYCRSSHAGLLHRGDELRWMYGTPKFPGLGLSRLKPAFLISASPTILAKPEINRIDFRSNREEDSFAQRCIVWRRTWRVEIASLGCLLCCERFIIPAVGLDPSSSNFLKLSRLYREATQAAWWSSR